MEFVKYDYVAYSRIGLGGVVAETGTTFTEHPSFDTRHHLPRHAPPWRWPREMGRNASQVHWHD